VRVWFIDFKTPRIVRLLILSCTLQFRSVIMKVVPGGA